jgi:K+-sensing histidine kinase KdpD
MEKQSMKSSDLCKSVIQTSYDIIKAHGGSMSVETNESGGATFIIKLNGN